MAMAWHCPTGRVPFVYCKLPDGSTHDVVSDALRDPVQSSSPAVQFNPVFHLPPALSLLRQGLPSPTLLFYACLGLFKATARGFRVLVVDFLTAPDLPLSPSHLQLMPHATRLARGGEKVQRLVFL